MLFRKLNSQCKIIVLYKVYNDCNSIGTQTVMSSEQCFLKFFLEKVYIKTKFLKFLTNSNFLFIIFHALNTSIVSILTLLHNV